MKTRIRVWHINNLRMDATVQFLDKSAFTAVADIDPEAPPESMLDEAYGRSQHLYPEPWFSFPGIANLYQSVPKAVFSYMNDSMNVGTWNQAFKASRKSGYDFKQSVDIADNLVMRTQAIYRDAFRPAVLSSSSKLGQMVAPLSTYVFNAANAITQDVLAGNMTMAEKVQTMAGAAVAGIFTNLLTDVLAGKKKIDPGDFIPLYQPMKYGFGAFGVPKQIARDVQGGHYLRGAIKAGAMLTPYGSAQIPQTIAGVQSILQGKTSGAADDVRAVVFGPQKGKYPK